MLTHLWILAVLIVSNSEEYGNGGVTDGAGGSGRVQVISGSGPGLGSDITLTSIISGQPSSMNSASLNGQVGHTMASFGFDDGLGKLLDKFRDGLLLDKIVIGSTPLQFQVDSNSNRKELFGGNIGVPLSFPFPLFPSIPVGGKLSLTNPVMQIINRQHSENFGNGYPNCGSECSQTMKAGYKYAPPYGTGKIDFSQLFGLRKSFGNHPSYPPQGCGPACSTADNQHAQSFADQRGATMVKDFFAGIEDTSFEKDPFPGENLSCGPSCASNPLDGQLQPNNRQHDPNDSGETVSSQNQPWTKQSTPQENLSNSYQVSCGIECQGSSPQSAMKNKQSLPTQTGSINLESGPEISSFAQRDPPSSERSQCGPACEGQTGVQNQYNYKSNTREQGSQMPSYGQGQNELQINSRPSQPPRCGQQCDENMPSEPIQNSAAEKNYLPPYNPTDCDSACREQQNESLNQENEEKPMAVQSNSPCGIECDGHPAEILPQHPIQRQSQNQPACGPSFPCKDQSSDDEQKPSDPSCDSGCTGQSSNEQANLNRSSSETCGSHCGQDPFNGKLDGQPSEPKPPVTGCGIACFVDGTINSRSPESHNMKDPYDHKPMNRKPMRFPAEGVPAKRSYPQRSKIGCQFQGNKDCQKLMDGNKGGIPNQSRKKPRRRCGSRKKGSNLPRRRRPHNRRRPNKVNRCINGAGINANIQVEGSVAPIACQFQKDLNMKPTKRRRPLRRRAGARKGNRRCEQCGRCGNRRHHYKPRNQGLHNKQGYPIPQSSIPCQRQASNGLPCIPERNKNLSLSPQKPKCNINPTKNIIGDSPCAGRSNYPGRRRRPGVKRRPRPKDDQITEKKISDYPTTNSCSDRTGDSEATVDACSNSFSADNPSEYKPMSDKPEESVMSITETGNTPKKTNLTDPENSKKYDIIPFADNYEDETFREEDEETLRDPEKAQASVEEKLPREDDPTTLTSSDKSNSGKPAEKSGDPNDDEEIPFPDLRVDETSKSNDAPEKTDAPMKTKSPIEDKPASSTDESSSDKPAEEPTVTPDKTDSPSTEPKDLKGDEEKPSTDKPSDDTSKPNDAPGKTDAPVEEKPSKEDEPASSTDKSTSDKPAEVPKDTPDKTDPPLPEPEDPKRDEETPNDAPEKTDAPVEEKPANEDEPASSTDKSPTDKPAEEPTETPAKTDSPSTEPKEPKEDEEKPSTDKPSDDTSKPNDAPGKTDAPVEEKPPKEDEPASSTDKSTSDKPAEVPKDTPVKTDPPLPEPEDPKGDEETPNDAPEKTDVPVEEKPANEDEPASSTDKSPTDKPAEEPTETPAKTDSPSTEPKDPKEDEEKPATDKPSDDTSKPNGAPEKTDAPVEEKSAKEDEPASSTDKSPNDKPAEEPTETPAKTDSPSTEPKEPKEDEEKPSTDKPSDDTSKPNDAPGKTDAPVEEKPPKEDEPASSTDKSTSDKPAEVPKDTPVKTDPPLPEPEDPKGDEETPNDAPEKTDVPVEEKPANEDEPASSTDKSPTDKPAEEPTETPAKTDSPSTEPKEPKEDEEKPSTDKPSDDTSKPNDAPGKTDAPVEEKPPKEDEPASSTDKSTSDKPAEVPKDTPVKTDPPLPEPEDPKGDEETPNDAPEKTDVPVEEKPANEDEPASSTDKSPTDKPAEEPTETPAKTDSPSTEPKDPKEGEEKPSTDKASDDMSKPNDAPEKTDAPVEEKPPKEDEPASSTDKSTSDKPAEEAKETPDKTDSPSAEPKDPKEDEEKPSTDKASDDTFKPNDAPQKADALVEEKPPKEDEPASSADKSPSDKPAEEPKGTPDKTESPSTEPKDPKGGNATPSTDKPSDDISKPNVASEEESGVTPEDDYDDDDYDDEDYYDDYSEDEYPADDEYYDEDYDSTTGGTQEKQDTPSDNNKTPIPVNLEDRKATPQAQAIVPNDGSTLPYFRRSYVII